MGEKGNAAGFGGSDVGEAVNATAEARGEAGESTVEMIGGLAAKTGGEFLAGAALGAATEKLEDRSKRKKAAGGGRAEH